MTGRHPLLRQMLDDGHVTRDELAAFAENADLVSRQTIAPDEPAWHLPTPVNGWEPERTVYTSLDPEKAAENRDAWDAAEFAAHRSSVIPLSDQDTARGHAVDPNARRSDAELEREQREVKTLYQRQADGRLPWMAPATFKWFKERERRAELRKRQRTAIIALLRKLGRDPMSPAVAAWVTSEGYDRALVKLSAAARRAGVAE